MIGQMRRREQKGTGDQGQIMCNEYVFSITDHPKMLKLCTFFVSMIVMQSILVCT